MPSGGGNFLDQILTQPLHAMPLESHYGKIHTDLTNKKPRKIQDGSACRRCLWAHTKHSIAQGGFSSLGVRALFLQLVVA